MGFNAGDKVEVHRRKDHRQQGASVEREWVRATVVRDRIGFKGVAAFQLAWEPGDLYRGPFIFEARMMRAIGPEITHTVMMQRSAPAKKLNDDCPVCHDRGEWRGLALVCRQGHGIFAG